MYVCVLKNLILFESVSEKSISDNLTNCHLNDLKILCLMLKHLFLPVNIISIPKKKKNIKQNFELLLEF